MVTITAPFRPALTLTHAAACFLAAYGVYLALPFFIYPEYSIFYREYGFHGCPTLSRLLWDYNPLHGDNFFRPTAGTLIPWLLQADLMEPRTIVFANSMFMGLLAFLVPTLFLPGTGLASRLLASAVILGAPAVMDSYVFSYPDATYLIFSALFVFFFMRAHWAENPVGVNYWIAVVLFTLALTSKEIGVFCVFVVFMLAVMEQGELRSVRWKRLIAQLAPFALMSVAFYLYMLTRFAIGGEDYAITPGLERLGRAVYMFAFLSNVKFPVSWNSYASWATLGYSIIGTLAWAALWLYGLFVLWRNRTRYTLWQYVGAGLLMAVLLVAFGVLGGSTHHVFPVLVIAAALAGKLWQDHQDRMDSNRGFALQSAMLCIILLGMYGGQLVTASNLLTKWRLHEAYDYNTRLFQDERLHAVSIRDDTHILVKICLDKWVTGCFVGVRSYLGRAGKFGSEEYIEPGTYDADMLQRAVSEHPDKDIWLLECRFAKDPPYVFRKVWPE